MTTYWLMLFVPLLAGLSPWKAKGALPNLQWFLYGAILIFIIGLRHEVGGDWIAYMENYARLEGTRFSDAIFLSSISMDIGFEITHWFSLNYLNGIYATNLICAAIFVAGLIRISQCMPIPWLALVVSMPYLVIVVAMGYTRQAAAIGFIMWGLIDLMNGKQLWFYFMVLLGSLFHKTAFLMLPVGFLYSNSIRDVKALFLFMLLFVFAFVLFIADRIQNLVYYYVTDTGGMSSSGAAIRVGMNVGSAFVFLYFRKAWAGRYEDVYLWTIFSVINLLLFPLAFVISTTIDRVALYFLPMQFIILSRVPIFISSIYHRTIFVLCVVFIYISIMFVWLNYGSFSSSWLPYRNIFFK